MTCLFCHAPMILATESRGYQTYRCKRGCDYHLYQEIVQTVEKNSSGQRQSFQEASKDSAPTAVTQ